MDPAGNKVDPAGIKSFRKVCRLAAEASAKYSMLQADDHVLAGLSGGMDSFVLLETLRELQKKAPFKFTLSTATVDPGFPGFNAQAVQDYCRELQIPHHILKLDIPRVMAETPPDGRSRRPCVWCSRLRRGQLYGLARELGATKLALGHHADDIIESFFISLVRGVGLTTMGPNVKADTEHAGDNSLRLIRPLVLAPEELVKSAAGAFALPAAGECMYKAELAASGDRAWAKEQVRSWQRRIGDVRPLILKSLGRIELGWLLDPEYME